MNLLLDKKKTLRDQKIDLLKTLAIIGVVVIHTSAKGFSAPIGSLNWTSALFWNSLMRAGVPIFLMCSGALLLNPQRELALKKLYLRYIARFIVAMFFWSMLYKLYNLIVTNALSLGAAMQGLKEVMLFKQETHFYYIHIIVLVYAFLPITRILVCNATKRQLEYSLAVWFAVGILYPTIRPFWPFSLLTGIPAQYMLNMAFSSIGYGILGYYLKNYRLSARVSGILAGFGFLFVFGLTFVMSRSTHLLYQSFLEGMSVGVAMLGAGIFGMCISTEEIQNKFIAKAVTYISQASFCIYLVHIFFIYILIKPSLFTAVPCLISIPLITAAILLLCICVYWLLSKLPIVNQWLI